MVAESPLSEGTFPFGTAARTPNQPTIVSLFENDQYRWRETFFVMLNREHRPGLAEVQELFRKLGPRYHVQQLAGDGNRFESVSVLAPDDCAAMDITYLTGPDVADSIEEFIQEYRPGGSPEEARKCAVLRQCDARYDVFHFEQIDYGEEDSDEELLDPGALLVVLEKLARLCHGVVIDPQSGTLL